MQQVTASRAEPTGTRHSLGAAPGGCPKPAWFQHQPPSQTRLGDMASRKWCLVLGLLTFLWAELASQVSEEQEEETCRLLGRFDLNGYVDAQNHSLVIGGLFPIHARTIPPNESVFEPVSAKCEG